MTTAITTFDNPYDPIDQFTSWFIYDVTKGYNTCGLLGRIARTSDQLSDVENEQEIESSYRPLKNDTDICEYLGESVKRRLAVIVMSETDFSNLINGSQSEIM